MGANYTFYVKTIETHARAFLTLNILAIGKVANEKAFLKRGTSADRHLFLKNKYVYFFEKFQGKFQS